MSLNNSQESLNLIELVQIRNRLNRLIDQYEYQLQERKTYFPLEILIVDTGEIRVANTPEDIPHATTIQVLKTKKEQ
jgi:hypothetical protein